MLPQDEDAAEQPERAAAPTAAPNCAARLSLRPETAHDDDGARSDTCSAGPNAGAGAAGKRRFDASRPFHTFRGDAAEYAWQDIQASWDDDTWVEADLLAHERRVIADRRQPAFADRLVELLEQNPSLPLVRSGQRLHHWLDELALDPEAEAASCYFTLSRGFFLLPPGTEHPQSWGRNYGSANDAWREVDAEIARLVDKGILRRWDDVKEAAGSGHLDRPTVILNLGVVIKRGKTRLVIDASAPHDGTSLNDTADLPSTRLANITMAMRAFSKTSSFFVADMEDAFHQQALGADSLRLAGICWRGTVFCYTRSFFGFAPAPSQAQTMAVALCRITTRRLRSRGLPCGDPPGWNHCWASSTPDAPTLDPRGELVADQDDTGGPGAYNRPAWNGVPSLTTLLCYLDDFCGFAEDGTADDGRAATFGFLHFLSVCELLGVRLKTAKCSPPSKEGLFLGIWCSITDQSVSLTAERVAELSAKLRALLAQNTVTAADLMSIVGVLVFCSVVIPAARCFYRRLLDALRGNGSRDRRHLRLCMTAAMRTDVSVWLQVLERYNDRPVSRGVSDPIFPHAGYSDAAFAGFGWHLDGTDLFDRDAWPASWASRIGMHSQHKDIYIVELELWGCLQMCRACIPLAAGGRFRVFNDNQSVCGMLAKLSTASRRCLPLIKELVGLLVVYGVTLIVSWVDTTSNRHADLLSRWHDAAEDKGALLAELRALRSSAGPRRRLGRADRRAPLRPDLADLFPPAVMDEYAAAADVSAAEASALVTGGWTASPLAGRSNYRH